MARRSDRPFTAIQSAREVWRLVEEVYRDLATRDKNYRRAQALLRSAQAREPNTVLLDVGRHRQAIVVLKKARAQGAADHHTVFSLAVDPQGH